MQDASYRMRPRQIFMMILSVHVDKYCQLWERLNCRQWHLLLYSSGHLSPMVTGSIVVPVVLHTSQSLPSAPAIIVAAVKPSFSLWNL